MLSWIDDTVAPCQDFHQFSCGKFPKVFNDSSDLGVSTLSLLRKRNLKFVGDILKRNSSFLRHRHLSSIDREAIQKARDFYTSCINEKDLKANISRSESLANQLTLFSNSHFPLWDNVQNKTNPFLFGQAIGDLHRVGSPAFFDVVVVAGTRETKSVVIKADPLTKAYVEKFSSSNVSIPEVLVNITRNLEAQAAQVLVGRNLTQLASDLFDLQFKIIQALAASQNETEPSNTTYTWGKLSNDIKSFDLRTYLKVLVMPANPSDIFNDTTTVLTDSAQFLKRLDLVMSGTSSQLLEAYMIWTHSKFMSSMMEIDTNLVGLVNSSSPTGTSQREQMCTLTSLNFFEKIMSKIFIFAMLRPTSRLRISRMIDALKSSFSTRIKQLEWLDESTRTSALKKLNAITAKIGFPNDLFRSKTIRNEYSSIHIFPTDYYANLVSLRRKSIEKQLESLSTKKAKTQWATSSIAVNAYYDLKSNEIVVPAGILQSPAFSIHQPSYVNYGGIGFIIGHELTHAFDVQGATRNAQGVLENWWSKDTREKFQNRTDCMAQQYSNYSITFDGNVTKILNGNSTLGENMADNGGLKRALDAYRIHKESFFAAEDELEEYQGARYTAEQLFFISFAQIWCHVPDKAANGTDALKISEDVHSPERFRVNGVVSNSEEFSKAFQCKPGQPMNPVKKCVIW